MAFKLKVHKGHLTGLVAVCDVCGDEVVGDHANILWLPKGVDKVGQYHPYYIACKDPCTRLVDARFGHQYSQELDTAIGFLMNNARLDMKRVRRNIELLGSL